MEQSEITGAPLSSPTRLADVWKTAMRFAETDKRMLCDIQKARSIDPSQVACSDFLRECAWAILGARRSYEEVLKPRWPDIEKAFFHWDIQRIVTQAELARTQVLQVLNSPRKVNGIIEIARWLNKQGWTTVRAEFLRRLKADSRGGFMVTDELLKWLDQLPWVGRTLAAYIAKNLGISSIKDDVWMCRLAGWLDYSPNTSGVWQMARDMQVISGEKVNVIDTVLWNWAKTQKCLV